MCSRPGRSTAPPTAAATNAARRYWPSTPMLNRFIRKPMATASAGQVVRRRLVEDVDAGCRLAGRRSSMRLKRRRPGCLPASQDHQGGDDERDDEREQRRRDAERAAAPSRSARSAGSSGAPHAALRCAVAGAGHGRAELLGGDRGRVERRRPAGREDHLAGCRTGRSARRGRRRSAARPGPSRAGVADVVPDRGLRADVHAAGGVGGDQQPGSPLISRPTISFCWLPPDSAAPATSMPGVRTSYSLDDPLGVARGRRRGRCSRPRGVGLLGLVAEDAVLPQRGLEQQPVPVPVLGDVADAGLAAARGWASAVMSSPSSATCPRSAARMPMIASTSSAWPLPSTPAMPRTSPLWIVKRDVVETARRPSVVGARCRPSHARAPTSSVTVDSRVSGDGQLAADHQLGELRGR